MIKKKGILGLVLWSYLSISFATGPTTITAEIVPIAINPAGDVLCKSRYSENATGSHSFMPTNYGLCLVKNGNINPIPESDIHFAPDFAADDFEDSFEKMEQQFKEVAFTKNDLLVADFYDDLVADGFEKIALEKYRLDPHFSIASFYDRWNVDYEKSG